MVRCRAVVAVLLVMTWYGGSGASIGAAQSSASRPGGSGDGREMVRLMVRPQVGDTLYLQMEQTIEMRGRRGGSGARGTDGASRSPEYGPRIGTTGRVTRLLLFAHSLVESSDLAGTTVLATSDSVVMWLGTTADMGPPQRQALQDDARQVRVRVMPDGSMRMHNPPPGAASLGATLASVPGLLPETPVAVGSEWMRDMALPTLPVSGFRADGVVQVKLRLDSLTRGGRDAWVTLSGVLRRGGTSPDWPPGTRVVTSGTIRGHMLIDRQRAWIMSALTELDVSSELAPGTTSGNAPTLLDMHIVQQVRVR